MIFQGVGGGSGHPVPLWIRAWCLNSDSILSKFDLKPSPKHKFYILLRPLYIIRIKKNNNKNNNEYIKYIYCLWPCSLAITSTGRLGLWFLWFYVQEHPKAQPAVALVLKRLGRLSNSHDAFKLFILTLFWFMLHTLWYLFLLPICL